MQEFNGNQLQLNTWSNDRVFTAPYSFVDGNWHQLVLTYDGATMVTGYLDGASLGSQSISGINTVLDGSGLLIGNKNSCCETLHGSVDEFAVYPIALTPAQVLAH